MEKYKDAAVFVFAAAAALAVLHFTKIGCPIKFLTGVSCAGCGMTRAWLALASLNIKEAFYYHPLALIPPVYIIIFAARKKIGERVFKGVTAACVLLFLAVYVIRLLNPYDNIVVFELRNGLIIKILYYIGRIF